MSANPSITGLLYTTLIALYILEELFDHKSDEAEMIVRKAKKFLTQNGVPKPDNEIRKLSLELKR